MRNEFVQYEVGQLYVGPEESSPRYDCIGFIFEGVPVYKIWLRSPLEQEKNALQHKCVEMGLTAPTRVIGRMLFFVFENSRGSTLRLQAPMCSNPDQVERWANGDSNIFIFVLIDRGSLFVRSLSAIDVPPDMRSALVDLWSSGKHLDDLTQSELHEALEDAPHSHATIWRFNEDSETFQRTNRKKSVDQQTDFEGFQNSQIDLAVGEKIQFTRRVRRFAIPDKAIATIKALDESGRATIVLEGENREIKINLRDTPHLTYGYAIGSVGSKLQSPNRLLFDEDNDTELRRLISQALLAGAYVPVARIALASKT